MGGGGGLELGLGGGGMIKEVGQFVREKSGNLDRACCAQMGSIKKIAYGARVRTKQ